MHTSLPPVDSIDSTCTALRLGRGTLTAPAKTPDLTTHTFRKTVLHPKIAWITRITSNLYIGPQI